MKSFGVCASDWAKVDPSQHYEQSKFNWKPSIFMPRWASRITLEITEVKVERLQEISVADCFAEGLDTETDEAYNSAEHAQLGGISLNGLSPEQCAYRALWDRINGKTHPWSENPFVWVVSFKRILTAEHGHDKSLAEVAK